MMIRLESLRGIGSGTAGVEARVMKARDDAFSVSELAIDDLDLDGDALEGAVEGIEDCVDTLSNGLLMSSAFRALRRSWIRVLISSRVTAPEDKSEKAS